MTPETLYWGHLREKPQEPRFKSGGLGELCALLEKTVIQGKEIERGTDFCRAWNDTKVGVGGGGNFPGTVDSRMVSPGSYGVNKEEGRRQDGGKLIQVKKRWWRGTRGRWSAKNMAGPEFQALNPSHHPRSPAPPTPLLLLHGHTEVSDCSRITNLCDLGSTNSSESLKNGTFLVLTTRLKSWRFKRKTMPSLSPLVTGSSLTSVHCLASQRSLWYWMVGPAARYRSRKA